MKKLMTLAAMLAAGAAFAACDYKPETMVYKWKFTGKTTFGQKVKSKPTGGSVCGYGSGSVAAVCPIRTPASLKIEGYTAICSPGCGSDAFEAFEEVNEIFWQKKPFRADIAGGVSTDVSHIIGKKKKQFEAAGTAHFDALISGNNEGTYTLTYAGLGKYDLKHSRVKSVKGNFAGFLDQPYAIGKDACVPAGFWNCELNPVYSPLQTACDSSPDAQTSVAFGKWSAKFKKSASKKFNRTGELKVPSWVHKVNK